VVTRWAGQVRPRVIVLENVEEFAQWGPLVGPPDALRPCPKRRGESFRNWVRSLEGHGYKVEWRELRACDYGAPTIRKRLYLIARCDGQPIVWPEVTHASPKEAKLKNLKTYRTAAECIDFSIPMLSIFATKDEARAWGKEHGQAAPIRPLAENTNKRIARGVMRYVINNPKPFLVTMAHGEESPSGAKRWGSGSRDIDGPMGTLPCSNDQAVVSPVIAGVGGRAGQSPERSVDQPLGTVTAKGDAAVVAPIVSRGQHGGLSRDPSAPLHTITASSKDTNQVLGVGLVPRYGERDGQEPRVRSIEEPAPTVVNTDNGGSLVAASVTKFRTGSTGSELSEPLDTVTSNSNETSHPGGSAPLGIVAANLATYYGAKSAEDARGQVVDDPLATQPTENRHAVVASFLGQYNGGFAEGNSGDGHAATDPISTIATKGPHQTVVSGFLDQCNNGFDNRVGRSLDNPQGTVCAEGSPQTLVGTSLIKLKGTGTDADPAEPLDTVNAGGMHHGIAAAHLVTNNNSGQPSYAADGPAHTVVADGAAHNVVATHLVNNTTGHTGAACDGPVQTLTNGGHAAMVASFLQKYYGQGTGQTSDSPVHTIPTVDRFGFVTVEIEGQPYFIRDIAMRMLQPRELYNAQGFHAKYIIDTGADGRKLTKTAQVRMCGNSVCPPVAAALAKANVPEMVARKELRSA